ncbi:MAG: RNA polymerase sigma factor FliA [Methylococcales bacterium]|jgi:RNA polymerase sigma factor FliA|nr:RNA polymerase sigma factor FliA [Methylococcales bacterium]
MRRRTGVRGYAANANAQQAQDALVMKHASLVKKIAYHLISRLPSSVQVDDLIQSGMIGLLEASRQFDPTQGAAFETYAGIRIRGSMLDEVRKSDWTPRSVHKKSRMVSEAIREIEGRTGRDAKPDEIAKHLDITLDEYFAILQDSSSSQIFSVDELSEEGGHTPTDSVSSKAAQGPFEGVQKSAFKRGLVEAIKSLPEREQLIISLYYDEELNLKEIGAVLDVSESRVSQILSQATVRLRSRMGDWVKPD